MTWARVCRKAVLHRVCRSVELTSYPTVIMEDSIPDHPAIST